MAFNLVVLTGRLTSDPELKTTANNVAVTSFNIAVDRGYGDNKQTDFITLVAWRKTAELITKHFRKGSLIGIEGSIQTRNYEDKNGNKRTAFEVVVDNVQFLESKKNKNVNIDADEPPQSFSNNSNDFADLGEAEEDDLPF
jgi:single-strand DNA-binding protein